MHNNIIIAYYTMLLSLIVFLLQLLTQLLSIENVKAVLTDVNTNRTLTSFQLTIPYPSGIEVDRVLQDGGMVLRIGRISHSAVALRPDWQGMHLLENVLTSKECENIINLAEVYAAAHGWSRGRHIDYSIRPVRDLPVKSIFETPSEYAALVDRLEDKIFKGIADKFRFTTALTIQDLFITKYEAGTKENLLGPHKDVSLWSFVVVLNVDYSGGGTYFFESQSMWRPPLGGALYFNGKNLHGGSPITEGVRYILAGFVDVPEQNNLDVFSGMYNPVFDGYAFLYGFRTGDRIVALEVCEIEVSADSSSTFSVQRRMLQIQDDMTDEEWVTAAQSCENEAARGQPTRFIVNRWV